MRGNKLLTCILIITSHTSGATEAVNVTMKLSTVKTPSPHNRCTLMAADETGCLRRISWRARGALLQGINSNPSIPRVRPHRGNYHELGRL